MNKSSDGKHTDKPCRILECICSSEYQDKRYGRNMRVHNPKKEKKYACTVCGKMREA